MMFKQYFKIVQDVPKSKSVDVKNGSGVEVSGDDVSFLIISYLSIAY